MGRLWWQATQIVRPAWSAGCGLGPELVVALEDEDPLEDDEPLDDAALELLEDDELLLLTADVGDGVPVPVAESAAGL